MKLHRYVCIHSIITVSQLPGVLPLISKFENHLQREKYVCFRLCVCVWKSRMVFCNLCIGLTVIMSNKWVQENSNLVFFLKERTQDEIERTKQFSKDVVDLLRHQPHFRMPFNKFIPSYHHHFGRQCKLAYYGFTKLLELFEAIPDILQVSEEILIIYFF